MPMTPERIAEIKERCEEATPGVWCSHEGTIYYGKERRGVREHCLCCVTHSYEEGMFTSQDVRDGQFIAHSRTDLPDAIAEVERLLAENARLREACERVIEGVSP